MLDSPGHSSFDDIVRLVSLALDSSIAMISLMDERRQWFLASRGIDVKETPRELAFCNYPVAFGKPLLVRDTRKDTRFADSILANSGPQIRSYIGYPVRSPDGHVLGTVCAADRAKDKFNDAHVELLENLSALVEQLIAAHALNLELDRMHRNLAAEKDRLEQVNLTFRQMEKIARIGAWEFDVQNARLIWSDSIHAIHGHPKDMPIDGEMAIGYIVPHHRPKVREAIRAMIAGAAEIDTEVDIITRTGEAKRAHIIGQRREVADGGARIIGVLMDVTDRHNAHLALKRAAEIDDLTGLLNRNAFVAHLDETIRSSGAAEKPRHLMMFDLDGLKDTNEIYGHTAGDLALREVSARIASLAKDPYSLARWGGDEFAVTIPGDASTKAVYEFARRVIDAIAVPIEQTHRTIYLRATCGVAECEPGISGKELVRRANQALHLGKTTGMGLVHFYDRSFEERKQARKAIELEIRAALEHGRIFARYQPIVDLRTGRTQGYEALLRLTNAAGEEMTAAQLLPALVEPELSRLVASRMMTLVAADFAEISRSPQAPDFVSINATEADLLGSNYVDMLLSTLAAHDIPTHRVTLEVTETMLLVNDLERMRAVLERLKAAGVSIALDDFGTGFSSLTHLKVFPIDKVKIDRSFVCDIAQDRDAHSIVAGVIAMARSLSIDIIAEGIETPEQLTMLCEMGCHLGQGFLLSRPLLARDCRSETAIMPVADSDRPASERLRQG
ncbi:hypothetical protein JI59_06445 [Novosphingobium pentaromativorans US6-1]|uniref:Uncharacterized protein n=1 Tax=Novosphingobium pentaromativorans US6-1 TaxID=1088721 RepID=G6EEG4_9SPHN|nr:hypothetical protein JI59_06445 [Novosphingobium pentaromativorans US6-1]EHJ60387.1 hypothetical protein NSU_2735 [Novosphingobium pentaromativorans US6-1]